MTRYVFFSVLALGLFWGLYRLLLSRDRCLSVSRGYLLLTLFFSLTYPFLRLPEMPDLAVREFVARQVPTFVVQAEPMPVANTIDTQATYSNTWLWAVYIVGALLAALPFIINVLKVALRLNRLPYERRGGIKLTLLDDESAPFSFFNHVVIGRNGLSDIELQGIVAHETLHAQQRHSLDVLFVRACCCVAWFNPFVWLYLRDIKAVHEYLADEAATAAGDREGYLQLLFRQVTGFGYGHITNNFQSINLKKRIEMMKQKKSRFGAWKLLAALPLAVLLMAFGCQSEMLDSHTAQGKTLLTVKYHKEGGKRHLLSGLGYNKVQSQCVGYYPMQITVNCSGEGYEPSHGTWEISELQTSKGVIDGRELNRYEKKLLRAVDRKLRIGERQGALSFYKHIKAEGSNADLCFNASWKNGNANGDADITLMVMEDADSNDHGDKSALIEVVEDSPEFIGGDEAFYKYLAENIKYPEQAKNEKIQGRVFVTFIIEADGSVTNAKVLRGIGGGCDEEALRVVNAMPKWKPGMQKGKPVRVNYNLPILFKLQ